MSLTREDYERWVRDSLRPRYPELESALVAAIDAYFTIQHKKKISSELLKPIVEAASSSRRPLFENATGFLGALTGQFAEARDAVTRMAYDSQSHVRFNAIISIGKETPRDFCLQIIRAGLRDKSARVRGKAADWAGTLRLFELVPDLEQATESERNEKTKMTMDSELRLLRDGYILESGVDGGFNVTTFSFSSMGGITSRWVSRTELDEKGVEAIVAELRKPRY